MICSFLGFFVNPLFGVILDYSASIKACINNVIWSPNIHLHIIYTILSTPELNLGFYGGLRKGKSRLAFLLLFLSFAGFKHWYFSSCWSHMSLMSQSHNTGRTSTLDHTYIHVIYPINNRLCWHVFVSIFGWAYPKLRLAYLWHLALTASDHCSAFRPQKSVQTV